MEVELGPASGPEGGAVDSEKQRIVNRETDPLGLNNCIISSAICINLGGAVFAAHVQPLCRVHSDSVSGDWKRPQDRQLRAQRLGCGKKAARSQMCQQE